MPTVLTRIEVDALIRAVGSTKSATGARNMAIVQVLVGAGLRVSELVGLRGVDVDAEAGRIDVRDGKGGKDRVIWVDSGVRSALKSWDAVRRQRELNGRHPYFVGIRDGGNGVCERKVGAALSVRTVQELIGRLAAAAGIEKRVSPHTLRHTYASLGLSSGLSIRQVQELLGHSDVSTTEIYTHVNQDELRLRIQGAPEAEDDPRKALEVLVAGLDDEGVGKLVDVLRQALGK